MTKNLRLIIIFISFFLCYMLVSSNETNPKANKKTIRDINPEMFNLITEAQNKKSNGNLSEKIALYRKAINSAKNIKSDQDEFESYIHCKERIAGIYMTGRLFGGEFDSSEPQDLESLLKKALIINNEILEEIKGKEEWLNAVNMPTLYTTEKEVQFDIAVIKEVLGPENEAIKMLEELKKETEPYYEIFSKMKNGDKNILETKFTMGSVGEKKVKDINLIFFHSMGALYKQIEKELQHQLKKNTLLNPEKYPIIK